MPAQHNKFLMSLHSFSVLGKSLDFPIWVSIFACRCPTTASLSAMRDRLYIVVSLIVYLDVYLVVYLSVSRIASLTT